MRLAHNTYVFAGLLYRAGSPYVLGVAHSVRVEPPKVTGHKGADCLCEHNLSLHLERDLFTMAKKVTLPSLPIAPVQIEETPIAPVQTAEEVSIAAANQAALISISPPVVAPIAPGKVYKLRLGPMWEKRTDAKLLCKGGTLTYASGPNKGNLNKENALWPQAGKPMPVSQDEIGSYIPLSEGQFKAYVRQYGEAFKSLTSE